MTTPNPLSPAAQAVLLASAAVRCRQEWGNVNDPPCHPENLKWKGCRTCIDGPANAAALRAAAPLMQFVQDHIKLLAIATELERPHA